MNHRNNQTKTTNQEDKTMLKNSKLENLFKLSSKITVIVPATKNINEEIDNTPYVDRVASLLSDLFGGATATTTLGYRNNNTRLPQQQHSVTGKALQWD